MIRAAVRRLRGAGRPEPPHLSFGSWERLDGPVLAVCHPRWRGVRTAAYSHRTPVVEIADARPWADEIAERARESRVEVLVVQGWPPGSRLLVGAARARGLRTRVVLHSSMTQHGGEAGEAVVADEVLALARERVVERVGFVKEGLAEAFAALGYPAAYVPNRVPELPPVEPLDLGGGLDVGVFAEPFWRKNVVTQLGAVALLPDARGHVIHRPAVGYLEDLEVVEHGLQPWEEFVRLQASVDLNLCVTLSECHPLSPIESYAAGVPCLMSRTSAVFRDDSELWELTTVDELDNPRAIAEAAQRLLDSRDTAVAAARAWMNRADAAAGHRWEAFVS